MSVEQERITLGYLGVHIIDIGHYGITASNADRGSSETLDKLNNNTKCEEPSS